MRVRFREGADYSLAAVRSRRTVFAALAALGLGSGEAAAKNEHKKNKLTPHLGCG